MPYLNFTIAKTSTVITEPLRADGVPDYVAAFNERSSAGVLPESNAAVPWLQMDGEAVVPELREAYLRACGVSERPAEMPKWLTFDEFMGPDVELEERTQIWSQSWKEALEAPWSASEHPAVAAYLTAIEKLLAIMAEAAKRPHWYVPRLPKRGSRMLGVILPGLTTWRDCGQAFTARAMLRLHAGDFDGFLQDVLTASRLAWHISGREIYSNFVACEIDKVVTMVLARAVAAGDCTQQQVEAIARATGEMPPLKGIVKPVNELHRWEILDFALAVATWDAESLGLNTRVHPPTGTHPLKVLEEVDREAVDWDAVLLLINECCDRQVALLSEPDLLTMMRKFKEFSAELDADRSGGTLARGPEESRAAYSLRVGRFLLTFLMIRLDKPEEFHRRSLLYREMLAAVLGAAASKARTGAWPASLEELVPEFLPHVPNDPYAENPPKGVRYHVIAQGIRIYSIGRNGRDDQGSGDDVRVGIR
jgi:hypothetical protein